MNCDLEFLNIERRTPKPLTEFEDRFGLRASVTFFRLQYVWFPVHLFPGYLSNSSGQLMELIVLIIPPE